MGGAAKDARIRLTLDTGSALSSLRSMQSAINGFISSIDQSTVKQKTSIEKALATTRAKAASEFRGIGSDIAKAGKFGVALGGGYSLATAAKEAFSLSGEYKNLAFAIRSGTGELVKWQTIQSQVQHIGDAWAKSNSDVAATYRTIYEDSGNLEYTAKATESVAKASLATGKDIGLFASLATQAYEKFGIGTDKLDEALAIMFSLSQQGGMSLEDLSAQLGMLGASAKLAGASGVEGLSRIIGMAQIGDDSIGKTKQKVAAVTSLLEELSNPDKAKAIGKELRVNLLDKKGNVKDTALDTILSKTGGNSQQLAKLFQGPALKLVNSFGQAFKAGADTEQDKRKKVAAGLAAYHQAVEKASKAQLTAAEMEKQAQDKLESPKAQMTRALNELQNAFAKPEMLSAMKEMSRIMPTIADKAAKLLGLIIDHPVLAGAGYVGARVGGGALMAGAQSLTGSLTSSAAKRFGNEMALSWTGQVLQSGGKWKAVGAILGQAMGIASAAIIVEQIAEHFLNKAIDQDVKKYSSAEEAAATADAVSGTKDPAQMREALSRLNKSIEDVKKGPGALEKSFTGLAWVGNKAGLVDDADYKSMAGRNAKDVALLEEKKKMLEESLASSAGSHKTAADAADRLAKSTDIAARKLATLGGSTGSNGLPPSHGNAPGYSGG